MSVEKSHPHPSDRASEPRHCRGWRSRGYLPHFEGGEIPQSITFRLIDSLPVAILRHWTEELAALPSDSAREELRHRAEEFLDRGNGSAWLALPEIAEIIQQALLWFDDERYRLHAWVVMPNHVHALITPRPGNSLSQILHSWKSFTAKKANIALRRSGSFWQQEYFDRFIRDESHFYSAMTYIECNPPRAGLCEAPEHWQFGSAAWRGERQTR